jgi:outer membrane protein TolC
VRQSKADVPLAAGAYIPQLGASLGVSGSERDDPLSQGKSESKNYSAGINGKQMLFDGLKTVYDIKSAQSMVRSAKYDADIVSAQTRLNLRNAFVSLLKSQESLVIAQQILQRRSKNYELVLMRYKAGKEHRGSLLNAEASLAQARFNSAQAERSITASQRKLLKEMGEPFRNDVAVHGGFWSAKGDRKSPDYNGIARNHPGLLKIRMQRESVQSQVKSSLASFSPVISLSGGVSRSGGSLPPGNANWSAGIDATVPIFQSISTYYNFDKANALARQLKSDEASLLAGTVSDLEQKWIDWQNAIDMTQVQKKFLEAAEERAQIAEAQYAIGRIMFDNWIIIEDDLARAKNAYLDAEANELAGEAAWYYAKGETLSHEKK